MAIHAPVDAASIVAAPLIFLSILGFIGSFLLWVRERRLKKNPPPPPVSSHRRRRHH